MLATALAVLLTSTPVFGDSLQDIEHVVIFMQENRAFDSYFGTMAGVRGFQDPNVQVNADGTSVWYQYVDSSMSSNATFLLPFYLGYKGGSWSDAIQCMAAGDNGYQANQAALNHELNNMWARNNTPWSWGHLRRQDIPVQFALAEGWTSGDMYQESQITATNPNRVTLVSGSINVAGGPQTPDQGGVYIDNNEVPGCESKDVNCYPLKWKTIYEFYQDAGVDWQLFQGKDNFDDNPLAWFQQYQNASKDSPLTQRGMSYVGLDDFYNRAGNGTLPEVSFIVGPMELSEHPPYQPKDGGWLQQQVANAVINSPKYNNTLLIISYDETGGWGDHVTPFHSPKDTPGDWMEDPLGMFGDIFVGPGFRVPFYLISPWTRGGKVFTERADHNSQILFVEQWLEARGYKNVVTNEMVPWRRAHMSNLLNAFDFDNPDYSLPNIPVAATPVTNSKGTYVGSAQCQAKYSSQRPPVPYGEQGDEESSLWFEEGYKQVVGYLTEGRYLTFEKGGSALTNPGRGDNLSSSPATSNHGAKSQRWVIHYNSDEESQQFTISSALDGRWLGAGGKLLPSDQSSNAAEVKVTFLGAGQGYSLQYVAGSAYIDVSQGGSLSVSQTHNVPANGFAVWSVSYRD
ncbi:hypothetical protein N7510_001339 [Penicillium lagena]|uniref:uncharacterized protein n=1 Tax=Penicillium lagena TaxID=94218 RepID=UPI00253FA6BD|nr:uncharacterized protein N7510_001339 [Penicillium lagena]KAJ5625030.1 hypothetical protein N7510_001339 [Penicillium lagena]